MNAQNNEVIDYINNVYPEDWAIVPEANKGVVKGLKGWNSQKTPREATIEAIRSGKASGIGLVLGELSGYIFAIDCDGTGAAELLEQLQAEYGKLPATMEVTSGKPGHFAKFFTIPEQYRGKIKNSSITAENGDKLELRCNGKQTLAPSIHPETREPYRLTTPPSEGLQRLQIGLCLFLTRSMRLLRNQCRC